MVEEGGHPLQWPRHRELDGEGFPLPEEPPHQGKGRLMRAALQPGLALLLHEVLVRDQDTDEISLTESEAPLGLRCLVTSGASPGIRLSGRCRRTSGYLRRSTVGLHLSDPYLFFGSEAARVTTAGGWLQVAADSSTSTCVRVGSTSFLFSRGGGAEALGTLGLAFLLRRRRHRRRPWSVVGLSTLIGAGAGDRGS